jgi:hypothetical protein
MTWKCSMKAWCLSPFGMVLLAIVATMVRSPVKAQSVTIPRVDKMPDLPTPYRLRNWQQVAADYTALAFDFDRTGPYLPLIRWQDDAHSAFFLPSYLGGNGPEAINCLAAVVTGTLAGHDMTRYRGHDWVALCRAYYSVQDGIYTNNLRSRVSGSAWYDIFPNILFYQLADRYPNAPEIGAQLQNVAEQWYRACVALGGKTDPASLPDFDHTGFRFETMQPVTNGQWTEPDMAGGIAWLETMVYARHKDPRYLTAADWCLRALTRRPAEKNPLYEVLLPYGAVCAARLNAELGRDYDVSKLLNWCFEPGDGHAARVGWGVVAERFGDADCHGLVGSVTDTDGYAFAMNTFEWAGALAPLARYDPRYARSIGKWLYNLSNAARLFYPASLPAAQQDNRAWAAASDPASCLPYEGVRHKALRFSADVTDERQGAGRLIVGSDAALRKLDNVTEDLTTARDADGTERLEHTWKLMVPYAGEHSLEVFARCLAPAGRPHGFRFLWSMEREGSYLPLFVVNETGGVVWHSAPLPGVPTGASIYVRAVAQEGSVPQTLQVDQIRVRSLDPACAPFATGDALEWGGPSNLCLYGGSHVGLLGALVMPTGDERIPGFDLLATDWFHAPAYPTRLYYNPYPGPRHLVIPVGHGPVDLYDAVTHRFLLRNIRQSATLTLPSHTAIVATFAPAHGHITRHGHRILVNGVIVDYNGDYKG